MAEDTLEKVEQQAVSKKVIKPVERWKMVKGSQGEIRLKDKSGKEIGAYEKGLLDLQLPSGEKVNLMVDSRIAAQAQYQPGIRGFVVLSLLKTKFSIRQVHQERGGNLKNKKMNIL